MGRGRTKLMPRDWATNVSKGRVSRKQIGGSIVVGLLLFGLIGFIAGGYSAPDDHPSIDFSEENWEIVSDALRRLQAKDHTIVSYDIRQNLTTGTGRVSHQGWQRIELDRTNGRYHISSMNNGLESGNISSERYQNPYSFWVRIWGPQWRQVDISPTGGISDRWLGGIFRGTDPTEIESKLSDTSWTVVTDDESQVTLRSSGTQAMNLFSGKTNVHNATVIATITKSPSPNLRRLVVVEYGEASRLDNIYEVEMVGNTTVMRPDSLPPITIQEVKNRILLGWDRLLPFRLRIYRPGF